MSDSSFSLNIPVTPAAQLGDARLKRWHQDGEALLTIENLRSWINAAGLVLFVPRPQIATPTPSLVEAVLGATNSAPTLAQTTEARSLLARLVAEGIAVPLNLLGAPSGAVGETPDFVASAAVFSYIFTLRGDKAWKQPPSTSGTVKVSQLAAATYEALGRRGSLSAYDLTTELGKEVTESAVLRALGELWSHLRVLPVPQQDGQPTLWELAGTRFIKQIKAGANAGQPSALSALISLYLGQAVIATEEEIEVFLSPLSPRSRIRDVIHALVAARQLETLALEGRTMLHLTGDSPAFLNVQPESRSGEKIAVTQADSEDAAETTEEGSEEVTGERIKKYVPKPRKVGTGYLAKGAPARASRAPKPESGDRSERERRPFQKRPAGDAKRFDKPWDEGATSRSSDRPARDADAPRREYRARPDGERRPYEKRPAARTGTGSFDRPRTPRPTRSFQSDDARPRSTSSAPRREYVRKDSRDDGWKPAFRAKRTEEGFSHRPPRERSDRPDRRETRGALERQARRSAHRSSRVPNAREGTRRPVDRSHSGNLRRESVEANAASVHIAASMLRAKDVPL